MPDRPPVDTLDEREFEDAVRWLQAARLEVAVDAVRRAFDTGVDVHPALVEEINRLLTRHQTRHGFRRWRDPEG